MLNINEKFTTDLYSAAIGHFFVGLVKADAGLSMAQIRKIELLIFKMKKQLPGKHERTIQFFHKIQEDPDYQSWTPEKHGTEGLRLFELAVAQDKPQKVEFYIEGLLETMEIIIDVGEVTPGEKRFLDRMQKEFLRIRENLTA